MKRSKLGAAVGLTAMAAAVLSACGESGPDATPPAPAAETGPASPADAAPVPLDRAAAATRAVSAVPDFATLYPGGRLQGEPLTVEDETAPGGVFNFTTPDSPAAVIDFYRGQAEAAGLASAISMTQGETLVYGAQAEGSGARVQIVATPVGDATSVQLTWSAGG